MRSLLLVACLVLGACTTELPPAGQILLYLDTDAPLPPAPGEAIVAKQTPALFDAVLVEVFEPGATEPCAGCTRQFALDAGRLERGAASFGLALPPGVGGYRVRARMFDTHGTLAGTAPEPVDGVPPASVVDVTVRLPRAPEEGIVERTVLLPTDAVGLPIGSLDEPAGTTAGAPEESLGGSWPGARRVPCPVPAGPGEVCIPGGAYWMGNPHARGDGSGNAFDRRRLVVVSPFFLDATEVTVARYREVQSTIGGAAAWSGKTDGSAPADYCTYTAVSGPHEDKPVMCVTGEAAAAHCAARGARLPTEAEWEYVASGLTGQLFVWGSDPPACPDAVLNRHGYGMMPKGVCMSPTPPGGAEEVGNVASVQRRDRLGLSATEIVHDLVGNASEWVRDVWNRQDEPCWSHGGVYHDPQCLTPGALGPGEGVVRGGAWGGALLGCIASARRSGTLTKARITAGFRCARSIPR
jgi:formylglycine-generating enzyme required for sulfatase activity